LLFPADFAGRGDMSRGALLLHSVATNEELPTCRSPERADRPSDRNVFLRKRSRPGKLFRVLPVPC
jgi:hypothetical protein